MMTTIKRQGRTTVKCPCCGDQPIKTTVHDGGKFGPVTWRGCAHCGKSVAQCDNFYFIRER